MSCIHEGDSDSRCDGDDHDEAYKVPALIFVFEI